MYSQSSSKLKLKIVPMKMDFDFTIKNHPEFFTKLSSRDRVPEHPPPASGGFSSRFPSAPDGYLTGRGGGGQPRGRVEGLGATLKPKIYPPTLMRNAKPKRFFK
jgi:hypothetical protein